VAVVVPTMRSGNLGSVLARNVAPFTWPAANNLRFASSANIVQENDKFSMLSLSTMELSIAFVYSWIFFRQFCASI
jgi:hypothetical protein